MKGGNAKLAPVSNDWEIRVGRLIRYLAFVAPFALLGFAATALAEQVDVTTTADVVGDDGEMSLREGVERAVSTNEAVSAGGGMVLEGVQEVLPDTRNRPGGPVPVRARLDNSTVTSNTARGDAEAPGEAGGIMTNELFCPLCKENFPPEYISKEKLDRLPLPPDPEPFPRTEPVPTYKTDKLSQPMKPPELATGTTVTTRGPSQHPKPPRNRGDTNRPIPSRRGRIFCDPAWDHRRDSREPGQEEPDCPVGL